MIFERARIRPEAGAQGERMECPRCGGAMRRGEVQGEEPREVIFLCTSCGYACTPEGAAWPLEFDQHKWVRPCDAVRYNDLGVMECPKCGGPMRCVELQAEPAAEALFVCKWCGFSREKT